MGWENSFTIELGGKFITPAKFIPFLGEELIEGILALMEKSRDSLRASGSELITPFSVGGRVKAWLEFLLSREHSQLLKNLLQQREVVFDFKVMRITRKWQQKHNLKVTGFVDTQSFGAC